MVRPLPGLLDVRRDWQLLSMRYSLTLSSLFSSLSFAFPYSSIGFFLQPPLVAVHPVHRMVAVAPPGVNWRDHRRANMPFAGEADVAAAKSPRAANPWMRRSADSAGSGEGTDSRGSSNGGRVRFESSSSGASASSGSSSGDSASSDAGSDTGPDADAFASSSSGGSEAEESSRSGSPSSSSLSASDAIGSESEGRDASGLVTTGGGRDEGAGGRSRRRISWDARRAGPNPADFPPVNEGAVPALTEERPALTDRLFAVVHLGGRQYKITPGDIVTAECLPGAAVGSVVELAANDVHLVGSRTRTVLGRPFVPGARVRLGVEEQAQDAKVIVFKKNRRKRYQKTQGHRRLVTRLRVLSVAVDGGIDTL